MSKLSPNNLPPQTMRIIGGSNKGFQFHPPKNIPARPTTDLAKEALFNILNNTFEWSEINTLDLFGGTGSISYELASRGCTNITLVELDKRSIEFVKQTTQRLNMPIVSLKTDVFKFIATTKTQYNLIFADPPYALPALPTLPNLIFEYQLLKPDGWLILEHSTNQSFDNHPNFIQKRNYGETAFSIFEQPITTTN